MEPLRGFWPTFWHFVLFLPFFGGLLVLGTIKGIIFGPLAGLILLFGNTAIILVLWPLHVVWTYYSVLRAKQLGPVLKLVLFVCLPVPLVLWPILGIAASIICGLLHGFLVPVFATFKAVGEGKTNKLYHCFYDGTWDSVKKACTTVRDFKDVCHHSYLSYMDDLQQGSPDGKFYEIRLLYLPGAVIAGTLGFLIDFPTISLIALCKSPYMLFKGWHRLFHDLIGREGPFLETICVPFAGLAIILWPAAVVGAVLASMVSSIFLGFYAGVIAYQEESFRLGLYYIVASLSLFDEHSNDVLDMPLEKSCFPRPKYRKKDELSSNSTSRASSFSRPGSFKGALLRSGSINNHILDLSPLEQLDRVFKECRVAGENFVSEGLITQQDIEDAKSKKGSTIISIGLPAYCLLQGILRSAKANVSGLLLLIGVDDHMTEISSANRPRDAYFDWFFSPILVLKEQIKAASLSEDEEDYLCKLVLFNSDPVRLKSCSNIDQALVSERRRAEFDGLARRLHGLTKSVSRFPTSRRHFDKLVKNLSEDLAKKNGEESISNRRPRPMTRSKSAFVRVFSQKSFKRKASNSSSDQDSVNERNVEISDDKLVEVV